MIELVLSIAVLGFAICACVIALELVTVVRRWWFFKRTRRHVEREWREYYERIGHGSRKS